MRQRHKSAENQVKMILEYQTLEVIGQDQISHELILATQDQWKKKSGRNGSNEQSYHLVQHPRNQRQPENRPMSSKISVNQFLRLENGGWGTWILVSSKLATLWYYFWSGDFYNRNKLMNLTNSE